MNHKLTKHLMTLGRGDVEHRPHTFLGMLFALFAFLLTATPVTAQPIITTLDLNRIQRATVYVMQTRTIGTESFISCVGTGTIVNRFGFVVTNAHNTVSNRDCTGDNIIIALADDPEAPPIPTYQAEVAQVDPGLDLALLQITAELSGRRIDPQSLALPFVELGDSSGVNLDDTITIVGYPDIGDAPIGVFRGTISGFVAEPNGGERSWFKTDATIPGTVTGGGVYNQQGQLIAIPTTVPIVTLNTTATCIPIEDTNNDNIINDADTCVPIGGFINALRPSNFIRPLLRGASLGIQIEKLTEGNFAVDFGSIPTFSRLFISPAVTEGMPTTVARNLPTGTNRLYLFFDYSGMTPETIYEMRVTIDDIPSTTFSLAPVRWSGGRSGLWYIGIGSIEQALPNGTYEFTLSIDGLASQSVTIIIGAAPQDDANFSNIIFGIEAGENLFGTAYVLPTGNIVSARFIHRNIVDGMTWSALWYYNDAEIPNSRIQEVWVNDGRDTRITRLQAASGLPAGRYRLELYIEGRLSATADFTIAGASEGAFPRAFNQVRTTTALTPEDAVSATDTTTFSGGVRDIYAIFDWEQLAPGTLWRMRWSVDDVIFYDQLVPWNNLDNGTNYITRLSSVEGIPDGSYKMELFINTVELAEIEAEVGIGQLTIDPFAQTEGVQLNGFILDAETGEGLSGVSFILISEDFSVADFVWDIEQVYAIAVTDSAGRFQLDRPLQLDAPYSLVIEVDGYLPIRQDAIVVNAETANPLEVVVVLKRDGR